MSCLEARGIARCRRGRGYRESRLFFGWKAAIFAVVGREDDRARLYGWLCDAEMRCEETTMPQVKQHVLVKPDS